MLFVQPLSPLAWLLKQKGSKRSLLQKKRAITTTTTTNNMKLSISTLSMMALVASSTIYFASFLEGWLPASLSSASNESLHHQRMMQDMFDFFPLSCNADLDAARCVPWSSRFGTESTVSKRIIIACGECVVMNYAASDTLTLAGGMDIRGKLVFPDNGYSLTLFTPLIAIQGELEMASTAAVDGTPPLRIVLTGQEDQFFTAVGENQYSCDGDSICNAGKKGIVVAGGKVTIYGLPLDTPTWVRLYDVVYKDDDVIEHPSIIVVDSSVKGTWVPGAEILITSHTREWNDHQVRKITKVSDYTRRAVQIELDAPIVRPTTTRQNSDFAVEVALLSRNIVFEGGKDDVDQHGGHFWVMNTPSVVQTLVGVDFKNFGQQGYLGRYPIHIHFCGDMTGSMVAKNTIRQSNQRCIVVHGTDNLLVQENVAYDTKGHCFIVEDGMETGNRFIRNLGAQTGIPDKIIPNLGPNGQETDYDPSTFWITNPSNIWIGNVAAGSQGSGYWFELKLRGTRKDLYPDLDPKVAPIITFLDNVAHSNTNKGFKTYPSGYLPDRIQTISGLKSYRNDGSGVFLHITRNVNIDKALVADNRNIGIDIDRSDSITLTDSEIDGETESFSNLIATQNVRPSCLVDSIYGIELHTWKNDPSDAGVTIKDILFYGFNDSHCPNSIPFHYDNNSKTGAFDLYTTLAGITVDANISPIDFCDAEKVGVDDVYIIDLDGSLRPAALSTGSPSTLVSNQVNMLNFVARGRCTTNEARCYSYCDQTCFRSVRFEVDPADTEEYELKVCKRSDPKNCIQIAGYQRVEDATYDISSDHRVFIAHLPAGAYDAVFLGIRGSATWPSFVRVIYEESLCPTSFPDEAINLIEPPPSSGECTLLIRNGSLEKSDAAPTFWTYRLGGIQLVPGAGVGGSNAMAGIDRLATTTLVQYIDTRCLKQQKGRFYELSADIKLESSDGSQFYCDSAKKACPEIGIYTAIDGYQALAVIDPVITELGFQTARVIFAIDERLASATEARFDVKSNVDGKLIYVDNVSMKLVPDESIYCEDVILKSKSARERFWDVTGAGVLSIVQGPLDADPSVPTRQAIRFGGRKDFTDGIYYTGWRPIETACLEPGSSWKIAAQLQLVYRATGAGVSCVLDKECPAIRVIVKDAFGALIFTEKYQSYVPNANGFNLFKSSFTLPSSASWDGTVGNVVLDIRYFPVEYDLIVGAFSMNIMV